MWEREKKEGLGRSKYPSLRSVGPIFIVSDTSQRYFHSTLNTMAQTYWKKGKVNKMRVLSNFLSLLFYLGFKRVVLLTSNVVDEYAERRQMSHTPKSTSLSLQKPPLKFILGRPAVTLTLAGQEAVFLVGGGWGGWMSAILPVALRPELPVKSI